MQIVVEFAVQDFLAKDLDMSVLQQMVRQSPPLEPELRSSLSVRRQLIREHAVRSCRSKILPETIA